VSAVALPGDLDRAPHQPSARLVARFLREVGPLVDLTGLYAGGSLASGDYHPGVSDLDLVALLGAPVGGARRSLQALHERLAGEEPLGHKLHCAYVPVAVIDDLSAEHLTWTTGRFWPMQLSGVARAELLRFGLTVAGPPPAALVPALSDAALHEAVRGQLSGYWSGALRKPHIWLQDTYVDLGLVTVARAEIALTEGRLATKSEALSRLDRWGVRPALVAEMRRRRDGEATAHTPWSRLRRARHAHAVVRRGIATLLRET
jgi:nucleotidyltransferase-like protein